MKNLAKDYFKRDLSEAELDKLEAQLEDQAQALKFLGLAKKRYAATGLPDPVAQIAFWKRFRWSLAWAPALAALLLVVLLPVAQRQPQPLPVQMETAKAAAPERSKKAVLRKASAQPQAPARKASNEASGAAGPAAMPAAAPPAASFGEAKAMRMAPEADMAMAEAAPGIQLSLLKHEGGPWIFSIALAGPAQVQASILNPQGKEVRQLHKGLLPSGSSSLSWDLKDAQGQALPAGKYRFDVKSADSQSDLDFNLP